MQMSSYSKPLRTKRASACTSTSWIPFRCLMNRLWNLEKVPRLTQGFTFFLRRLIGCHELTIGLAILEPSISEKPACERLVCVAYPLRTVRKRPFASRLCQFGQHRIGMDVTNNLENICICFDGPLFCWTLEQSSAVTLQHVEVLHEGVESGLQVPRNRATFFLTNQ